MAQTMLLFRGIESDAPEALAGENPSGNNTDSGSDGVPSSGGATDRQLASELGYTTWNPPQKAPINSHGQEIFWNGKTYITRDATAHNVSNGWNIFERQGRRIGTFDIILTYVKP